MVLFYILYFHILGHIYCSHLFVYHTRQKEILILD